MSFCSISAASLSTSSKYPHLIISTHGIFALAPVGGSKLWEGLLAEQMHQSQYNYCTYSRWPRLIKLAWNDGPTAYRLAARTTTCSVMIVLLVIRKETENVEYQVDNRICVFPTQSRWNGMFHSAKSETRSSWVARLGVNTANQVSHQLLLSKGNFPVETHSGGHWVAKQREGLARPQQSLSQKKPFQKSAKGP